jgi:Domain of unknown function (DUF4476)
MKKIFTLLFASLFSLSLLAFDGSRLSISAPGTSTELKVEIDGRKFSMQNNAITVGYLAEGYHDVKIYRDRKRSRNAGGDRSNNGFGFDRRTEIIYSNSVYLKRGFHFDITVNRFGKVLADERRIDRNDEWYNDEDEYYDNDNSGWNGGRGNVMTGREFETVKESLRKEWFENNRITSVKTIADKSNFTTQQVKELMLLFTFENNRLEVAKYAYRKTVDKQNYFQLNDALTFNSSKEELARFIRESR